MKRLYPILIAIILFASCEKLMMPETPGTRPMDVYNELWNALDKGYVYFGYKEIDWDSLNREFKPKIFDTMTDRQLYDTCRHMLERMMDPSVSLGTGFAYYNYRDTAQYKDNFNLELLKRNYWGNYEQTGPFIHTLIDSVGYVYYADMEEEVKSEQLQIIIERFKFENDSLRGMIFDLRNNRGGKINNLLTIGKRMGVDTNFKITAILYKTIFKNGPERDDLSEPQASYIEQGDETKFLKRFIVLTNRGTKAEAALLTSAFKGFQNVRVYGDTTGGSAGKIVGHELPNGWILQYPASMFLTDDDRNLEEGVAPDKRIDMDKSDEDQGKDTILEAALEELRQI